MTQSILDFLRHAVVEWGYWAVGTALLLENAGIPVPGETILLLASFVAYSEHDLRLPWIIAVGTIAATLGDNLGFALGNYGGRRLLARYQSIFRIQKSTIEQGERLFARYGPTTVFFARFVFGMRIIAGPLAGVLRMPWKKFAVFNALGATLWVLVITAIGYLFGQHWHRLLRIVERLNLVFIVLAVIVVAGVWYWRRRQSR